MRSISLSLTCLLALALAGCSDSTGPAEPGARSLSVASVSPANGATGVPATSSVTVTFDRSVDPATVTTASFTVSGASGTVSASGAAGTFTPSAPFALGATYDVNVSGVRDMNGALMDGAFTSSFTVASAPPVAPSAVAGTDRQVSFGAQITLDGSASTGTNLSLSWTQLEGPGVGALSGTSPGFVAGNSPVRLAFELAASGDGPISRDTVVIWVLEDGAHAYFVAPTGSDAAAGTRAAPFATVQHAIDVSDAAGNGGDVYVAEGSYAGSLTLRSRVSIYGGFEAGVWRRDVSARRPELNGGRIAVRGSEANDLTIDGMRISAANASVGSESSIGIFLHQSSGVTLRDAVFVIGNGAAGIAGTNGGNGGPGTGGSIGDAAGGCPPTNAGGSGGSSSFSRAGGAGGSGGAAGGFTGTGGQGSGGGGPGGGGSTGNNGSTGDDGDAAVEGTRGTGATALAGIGSTDLLIGQGANGTSGSNGWGGGGGGGGGGAVVFSCGGGGGGGGSGGGGGGLGTGGYEGGHSVGIVLGGTSSVTLRDLDMTIGNGGAGGRGGNGGSGGARGAGGAGGSCSGVLGCGGRGGHGTRGGHGGAGGGGLGGWSLGILADATASFTQSNVGITLGDAGASGGGGSSGGNPGTAGTVGTSALVHVLP